MSIFDHIGSGKIRIRIALSLVATLIVLMRRFIMYDFPSRNNPLDLVTLVDLFVEWCGVTLVLLLLHKARALNVPGSSLNPNQHSASAFVNHSAPQEQYDLSIEMFAHEISTPLALIQLAVTSLEDRRLTPEMQHAQIAKINRHIARMARMSNQAQEFGAALTNDVVLTRQEIDLIAFCRELVKDLPAGESQITLSHNADALIASTNLDALDRILSNLIGNAIKYSPENSPIHLSIHSAGDEFLLSVTDYGMGIPADKLEAIFHPYYRANQNSVREGFGLGLAIVQRYARLINAQIEVTSTPGKGSTFTIRLPVFPPIEVP